MARKKAGRFVCPQNGDTVDCPVCRRPASHWVEAWVQDNGKTPSCDTHGCRLVRY